MKKVLIVIFSFYIFLIILMPKIELYFSLEKFLKKEKFIISNEIIKDKWLFLSLKDGEGYFEGIKFADIANIKAYPLGFFNYISIENIIVDESLKEQNIKEFKCQVLDFILNNPPRMGVNWVCTMDVAIRASNMLIAYDMFIQVDSLGILDDEFKQYL